eukprot:1932019-Pyramimonas_sp.AAC.1
MAAPPHSCAPLARLAAPQGAPPKAPAARFAWRASKQEVIHPEVRRTQMWKHVETDHQHYTNHAALQPQIRTAAPPNSGAPFARRVAPQGAPPKAPSGR